HVLSLLSPPQHIYPLSLHDALPIYPADAAIIEVGLGGRFDATNVVKRPAVSVVMPISLDHEAYLGDRIELIAAEKAGILKPGCPDRKSTRLNSSHVKSSYAVFCLKK